LDFPYISNDIHELMELCNIAKRVSLLKPKLKRDDTMLLLYFAVDPATSAYEYATPLSVQSARSSTSLSEDTWLHKSKNEYRNAKNQIPRLIKLGLVEQVLDEPNVRRAKKCRLTKFGVYTRIESHLTPVMFKNMLMGYGDHPMFRFFVYPLLSQDTLLHMRDNNGAFLSLMCSYIHDCCEELRATNLRMDGDQLPTFIWENVRTGNHDAEILCDFLAHNLGCTWVDKAEIQKSDKIIEVSRAGYSSVLIRLSDDGKKAIVSYKDEKVELPVVKGTQIQLDDLTPSTVMHQVYKPRQLDREHVMAFMEDHVRVVLRLISSILSDYSIGSDTLKALAQSNKFQEALEVYKIRFDERYDLFKTL
jgi:hypothetical protein